MKIKGLEQQLKFVNVPNHIAIIMDGNGTWAKKRGLPRNMGHKKGGDVLSKITKYASSIGIKYLTVFAFSTENWSRPKEEVDYLMKLALTLLDSNKKNIAKDNIVLRVIGRRDNLNQELLSKINEVEELSKNNTGMTLIIAFNYGGHDEIINATKSIVNDVNKGILSINDITDVTMNNYLYTKDFPSVDLMIRTSKQIRISNFLLWQIAYSELYFTKTLWPDFTKSCLDSAINEYNKRERRYGGVK